MKTKRNIFITAASLALTGAMLMSCTACSFKASAEELSGSYNRKAADNGAVTEKFKTAMAEFSIRLFKGTITNDDNNDLVSPLSAALCLAMIANGAAGETKTQMEAAFGMDIEGLNESLYAFTKSLYSADDCKINIADSIWFRDDGDVLHINESFLQTNADWYDAQVYAAPFDASTVKDINNWCKHYTDGMIDKIIDRIDADSMMFLINALSFDAKWAVEYENKDISDGEFTAYSGKKQQVKMLSSKESIYISADGVTGFAKNYSGNGYSIVALLPEGDIYDYINSLDGAAWMNLWNARNGEIVNVKMPEFTYSAAMNLNETLQAMGMTDMFSPNADFSAMGSSKGKLFCSYVKQKTFIQVDRNGTKAAAITWGEMKAQSAFVENTVVLDRPFVFAIADNATGLPVFIGAVTNLN